MDTHASSSADLLLRLASGVRPGDNAAQPRRAGIESAGFADLFARVRAGELASGRPVEIAPGAGVELTADQLQRLAVALDAAEASGATRLLAMIDGRTLLLDVPSRTVLGAEDHAHARILTDFDAAVTIPDLPLRQLRTLFAGDGPGRAASAAQPGLDALRNASLTDILSKNATQPEPTDH